MPSTPSSGSTKIERASGDRRPLLRSAGGIAIGVAVVLVLGIVSLFIGVSDVSLAAILNGTAGNDALVLLASRIPRTLAVILSGMAMAVAGMIIQMLARNRFVEPSTAGTVESAMLGMIVVTLLAPGASVVQRMLVAAAFALAGTALFLRILRAIPLRSPLLVPLVGLMLGGVIYAAATFLAYRYDLLQSLASWTIGDFSGVLRGRYELLWLTAALTAIAYLAADRFTVAGMGETFTANLGLNYRRVLSMGLTIVAMVTAIIVATVGVIPFLGLIVPNVVSLFAGDNIRRTIPWVAILGAGFVLACDIFGRVVRYPYEIPIGTTVGVLGAGLFLYLLLRGNARAG